MAKFVYNDVHVTVGAVDLSDHVQSVTLDVSVTESDVTSMSDDWDMVIAGRKRVSGSITFYQDFAASEVDATIWPLVGTTTNLIIRPTSAAVGATNPDYDVTGALITGYSPVAGTYGDAAMTTVTFTGGTLAPATS
jgi:hypothetical protein